MIQEKIIVIGNGMVGYKFCEKMVERGLNTIYSIDIYGEEPLPAYDRVHLSEYFESKSADSLFMQPASWYKENRLNLKTSARIVSIDTLAKVVTEENGEKSAYDKLVLATGSTPFVPPIEGRDKKGVFVYRTIEDLDLILEYANNAKTGAVIGGGLLGLEAAKALKDLNIKTHVIEFAPRLMPRQLDEKGAHFLKTKIEGLGIEVHLNTSTSKIEGGETISALRFADNSLLDVDILIISAGIRPADSLGRDAGLVMGERGGIVVNNNMETSASDVYAIGEVALFENMIYGLVAPGYDMADVVVTQLAGKQKQFKGADMSAKLKLLGVDVASFGDPFCENTDHEKLVYENPVTGIYKRLNVAKDFSKILGGILVGEADDYNLLKQMVLNEMKLPFDPTALLVKGSGEVGAGVADLPDEAMICSCENVSKATICNEVESGTHAFADVKKCTKAGTGCGGCVPMVKDLINYKLEDLGIEVKNHICEHFEYSRQELFDIVKVKGYKTFEEVLHNHGHGTGCEVCKPAVTSIQASLWNGLVLEQDTSLDTNDRFLANIQRGGTYSVIPRVAGGEITPEKLLKLGEVADEYNLYIKITGGQRIGLYGAHLGDLPDIWEKLISVGFETGQAYGKSVRTVKSCVGSTWCRYGVQDSVKMAIDIEERYKGLRSPHKLKFAVSGCKRECAEAQGKDIGVIATEKGWALYVCGNGGANPQHAVLFATDLSTDDCIRYIDRILMFYIRTAAPLERTATWFNKLDGGLKYLQEVIINDSLGICSELEAHMDHHVDTFVCEWTDVVKDPAKRAKFKHFVNVPEKDPSIEFVVERGLAVPKPW